MTDFLQKNKDSENYKPDDICKVSDNELPLSLPIQHPNINISLNDCISKVQGLFEKYESYDNNPYMLNRLKHHIMNILPSTLENELKNHEKRLTRSHFLSNTQQVFCQIFLSENKYYYLASNNCFYIYDGTHYNSIKEDDIHYQLLSTISKNRTLMDWKYKTKINIIKQIKERSLYTSTPETYTLQKVIQTLYPYFLSNRSQVKYFLTILGDTILKKVNDLIFLIKPKTKKYLLELDNCAYVNIGFNNLTQNFMTKFHENYSYENCRLLKLNDTLNMEDWNKTLKSIGLDILVVATHYSSRYGSSEKFLLNDADEEIKSYTLFLKNSNQNKIIENFCKHSICNVSNIGENNTSLNWKNIAFIWKNYISTFSLPNVIYSHNLKALLKEKFEYDEDTDTFKNITSKYLPNVSDFIQFWDETISEDYDNEYEIDELCLLFKTWRQENSNKCLSNTNINEENISKIICHFYQNIQTIENKYVVNISCNLWNKIQDLNICIIQLKNQNQDNTSLIHFDELYNLYCFYCKTNNMKYIVSKRYFEKYLYVTYSAYILYDKFIYFFNL